MDAQEWCEDDLLSLTSESDIVEDFKIVVGLNKAENCIAERLEYAQDEKLELPRINKDGHNINVPVNLCPKLIFIDTNFHVSEDGRVTRENYAGFTC